MLINRDTTKDFLKKNGVSQKRAERMSRILEPFYRNVESGTYALQPIEILEREGHSDRFGDAISRVTGTEVQEIVYMSQKTLKTLPLREPRVKKWPSRENEFHQKMRNYLWDELSMHLSNDVGSDLWDMLHENGFESIPMTLHTSLYKNLRCCLWDSLWYFHGFAITSLQESSHEDHFADISKLVELLPHGLPFGELTEKPGHWIIVGQ